MKSSLQLKQSYKQFGGHTNYYTHFSEVCQSQMNFAVYLPPGAETGTQKYPILYWLSGLTCTEENFITKAFVQEAAKKHGVIIVAPDTSPRGTGTPGEDETYDIGTGAGFYVDATEPLWNKHYKMDSYITQELRHLVESQWSIDPQRRGIFGHSMGGHGALTLGLRNPELYKSISAFAPICAPVQAPWGIKAFSTYLGSDKSKWVQYDANELLKAAKIKTPILIDQGTEDEFLKEQLFTKIFEESAKSKNYPATIRMQEGYDHSYFFISTFIEEHIAFHMKNLKV